MQNQFQQLYQGVAICNSAQFHLEGVYERNFLGAAQLHFKLFSWQSDRPFAILFHSVLSRLLLGIQVALVLFRFRSVYYLEVQEITPVLEGAFQRDTTNGQWEERRPQMASRWETAPGHWVAGCEKLAGEHMCDT